MDTRKAHTRLDGSSVHVYVQKIEALLGRDLRDTGVEIHHVDGDEQNNTNSNLVVCPDRAYHALLHVRARALEACGDANKRQCGICRKWDSVANLLFRPKRLKGVVIGVRRPVHQECSNARFREKMRRYRNG